MSWLLNKLTSPFKSSTEELISLEGKYYIKRSKDWECLLQNSIAVLEKKKDGYYLEICVGSEDEENREIDSGLLLFKLDDYFSTKRGNGPLNRPAFFWKNQNGNLCFESKDDNNSNIEKFLNSIANYLDNAVDDYSSAVIEEDEEISPNFLFYSENLILSGAAVNRMMVKICNEAQCYIRTGEFGYEIVIADAFQKSLVEQSISEDIEPQFSDTELIFSWYSEQFYWELKFNDKKTYQTFKRVIKQQCL